MGTGRNLVVDSGTSLIFLPTKDYYDFFNMLKKEYGFGCFENYIFICQCSDS